jgi:hypothetical protein
MMVSVASGMGVVPGVCVLVGVADELDGVVFVAARVAVVVAEEDGLAVVVADIVAGTGDTTGGRDGVAATEAVTEASGDGVVVMIGTNTSTGTISAVCTTIVEVLAGGTANVMIGGTVSVGLIDGVSVGLGVRVAVAVGVGVSGQTIGSGLRGFFPSVGLNEFR